MAPMEAVDAVIDLLDRLSELVIDLRQHLQDIKEEQHGDDPADPRT